MAVAATHLTTGANATNGASYNTASVTPSAGALVLVWVSGTGTNSATAPTVTGNGLTYTLVTEAHSDGNVINEYLYRAMGTPSAGALNIAWGAGNVTGCNWSVAEFTDVDTTGTNGSGAVAETAVANANATSVTVTLADVAAGNATAGGFATADDIPVTPGAGYTELGEAMHNNPGTVIQSQWRADGSTTVDASWSTAQNSVGIGVEIKAAAAGGGGDPAQVTLAATSTLTAAGSAPARASATLAATSTLAAVPHGTVPIQRVQGATGTSSATGVTATLPAAPTAGNLLVAFHHTRNATSVTPPTGWTVARTETQGGTSSRIAYRVADGTDTIDVTFTADAAGNQTLTVAEFQGLAGVQADVADPATGVNTGTSLNVTTQSTGISGPTTSAAGLAFGGVALLGESGGWSGSWADGWTAETPVQASTGTGASAHAAAYKILAAKGQQKTSTSWTTARRAAGLVATFRATVPADTLDYTLVGAVTTSGATVTAKTAADATVRLAVSTSPDLSSPTFFGPATSDATNHNIVKIAATGLTADTLHYYGVEVDGNIAPLEGKFRTHPAGQASFTFALGSCAHYRNNADATAQGPLSTHPSWDSINNRNPLFFLHMGDFHYQDIDEDNQPAMRQAYHDCLTSEKQSYVFRLTPLVYTWSDHDYGINDSDGDTLSRDAVRAVYRQVFPHYPLAESGAIHHGFTVGRVRFLVLDCRSVKSDSGLTDNASKTMLGATQKQWLKDELLAAHNDTAIALTVLVSDVPWIDTSGIGDSWTVYNTERTEIADYLTANGITNVCLVAGDAHMVAIDDGTNNAWGGFPVFQAAAIDNDGSSKGGPYSHGTFLNTQGVGAEEGQFGLFDVADNGATLDVTWTGIRTHSGGNETTLVTHAFQVEATSSSTPVALAATSALTATGSAPARATAALSATSSLTAAGTSPANAAATLAASSSLAVQGNTDPPRDIILNALATLVEWIAAPTTTDWATAPTAANPLSTSPTASDWATAPTTANDTTTGALEQNPTTTGPTSTSWSTGPVHI